MGRLADRIGQRRLLRYATVGSGALSFAAQAIWPGHWFRWPRFRAMTGFFMGGLNTSVNSNVGVMLAAGSHPRAAFGVAGSAFSLGNALGPLLGGAITGLLSPRAVIIAASASCALLVGRLLVSCCSIDPRTSRLLSKIRRADRPSAHSSVRMPDGFARHAV
ncbi:MAG: MFS transporter [Thermomicrobiales bacterium]